MTPRSIPEVSDTPKAFAERSSLIILHAVGALTKRAGRLSESNLELVLTAMFGWPFDRVDEVVEGWLKGELPNPEASVDEVRALFARRLRDLSEEARKAAEGLESE